MSELLGAPLMVNPPGDALDSRVETELGRLDVDVVQIVGGTAAVSSAVESRLESLGYDVIRHAGTDRVSTAVAVANDLAAEVNDAPYVFLARAFGDGSTGFADSLGGGMLAGSLGAPLLLTETGTLTQSTRDYLAGRDLDTVWIIGGTAAVSAPVESQVKSLGVEVIRVAGANRFATASDAADLSFDPSVDSTVALVDGLHVDSWVAGFSASPFAGGAIALSNGSAIPSETADLLGAMNDDRDGVTVLLCAPQVPPAACNEADDLLNG